MLILTKGLLSICPRDLIRIQVDRANAALMEAISININKVVKKKLCLAIISHISLILIEIFKYMCFVGNVMLKKRNAQGLSITTIIIAVIGLIVIVVLIAVFTGKLAWFGQGVEKSQTCESVCSSLAKKTATNLEADGTTPATMCGDVLTERKIYGTFADVNTGKVCCCYD